MKAVDDQPVWSVVCFVVPAEHLGQGVAGALPDGALWFGAQSMYDHAGFTEVARRKPARQVVRLRIR